MDRKFCPLIRGKCRGDACMFWGFEEFENTATGEKKTEPGCLIVFQHRLVRLGVVEQIRTQASHDKVASGVRDGFRALVTVIENPSAVRLPDRRDEGRT